MKAKLILNNKEYEIEITKEQVKAIENPSKKRWKGNIRESYYFVDKNGIILGSLEQRSADSIYLYSIGNYFKTKEEAEEYKKKLIYQQYYRDYVNEHNDGKLDWNNSKQAKYYCYYNYISKGIGIGDNSVCKSANIVYSTSIDGINGFVKEIGEENFKKYILEVDD